MASTKFFQAVPDPQLTLESLHEVSKALKNNTEILTQQRLPKISSAVTWQDLLALGLITASQVPK